MPDAAYRNAPVAALIYEFLYDAYRMVQVALDGVGICEDQRIAPRGLVPEWHGSYFEWYAGMLETPGVLTRIVPSPLEDKPDLVLKSYLVPTMSLEDCVAADFSAYETFDNYCYAMFTLSQWLDFGDVTGCMSPRFAAAVAANDDAFRIDEDSRVIFDKERFDEKVMMRWDEMVTREFKAIA